MEIKFAGKTYLLPDVCASTNRQKAKLKKDLAEHGPEAFLASRKLSPLAGCVVDDLAAAGAEVVLPEGAEVSDVQDFDMSDEVLEEEQS